MVFDYLFEYSCVLSVFVLRPNLMMMMLLRLLTTMLLRLDDVRMMAMVIICFILAIFSVFFPTDVLHDDEELCFDLEKLMLENYVEIK